MGGFFFWGCAYTAGLSALFHPYFIKPIFPPLSSWLPTGTAAFLGTSSCVTSAWKSWAKPVSTPCGHNLCINCIKTYWGSNTDCHCPICREGFKKRPDLKVNAFILEVVTQFQLRKLSENQAGPPVVKATAVGGDHGVSCDVCHVLRAVSKVILLGPPGALRAQNLVAPFENPEVCVCQEHQQLHLHFCRDGGQLLCDRCAAGRHARHKRRHARRSAVQWCTWRPKHC